MVTNNLNKFTKFFTWIYKVKNLIKNHADGSVVVHYASNLEKGFAGSDPPIIEEIFFLEIWLTISVCTIGVASSSPLG